MVTTRCNAQEDGTPQGSGLEIDSTPTLSIGLAVYNGEQHLRESIDSLLAQDVEDLELVISDNASTDDTSAICLEYAAADSRVRYSRNVENIGAAANFTRAFEMCSGEYFMWGSDDDVWDPRFARLCIERLRSRPRAVQCTSDIVFITDEGDSTSAVPYRSIDTDGMPVEARVHELIARMNWYGIYSVIRPSALESTQGFFPVYGGDVRLLMELTLLGDSLSVPEPLFKYRLPSTTKSVADHMNEINPPESDANTREQSSEPYGFLARELLNVVADSSLDSSTVKRILDDFVETMTIENLDWGRCILSEQGLSLDELRAAGTASEAIRSILRLDQSPGLFIEVPAYSSPWTMRSGMKLPSLRHALLKLIRPFTDRQVAMDAQDSTALEQLKHEVRGLRLRVRELERIQAQDENRS